MSTNTACPDMIGVHFQAGLIRISRMPKGSDLFVAALENEGVDLIFGVPGRRISICWSRFVPRASD